MSDGKIVFCTKIDNSQVDKDLKQFEKKIRQSEESISKNENAKLPLIKQLEELTPALDEAKAKLEELNKKQLEAEQALAGSDPAAYIEAYANKPQIDADVAAQVQEVDKLQKQWDSINDKIDTCDTKIQQATADIARSKEQAAELAGQMNSSGTKMQGAFDKAHISAEKFSKHIATLAMRVFVFSVITAALNKIKQYMSKVLKTNEKYTEQLAQLKAALVTAFQPIYEFILPGLLAVLKVLTSIVSVVANVLSALGGKTLAQSSQNAKALNEEADALDNVGGAAKNAGKSLANFDEINTLGSGSSSGGSGGSAASIILGIMFALVTSVQLITEVVKRLLPKVPTDLVVFVISIALTVVMLYVCADIMAITVMWYYAVGAVVLGVFVAYGAMFGWDKFTALWDRLLAYLKK